jgi:hypothetical protein
VSEELENYLADEKRDPDIRFVGSVTAAVWKNTSKGGATFYTAKVQRSYKKDDKWMNTVSLGQGDLLNAAKALERAENWIARQ